MNRNIAMGRFIELAGMLLAACLTVPAALAQTSPKPPAASTATVAKEPARIGDATRQLLAAQRNAIGPDRPIPGEQAGLSHQRYLDSFKHPIPERTGSSISSVGGAKAQ